MSRVGAIACLIYAICFGAYSFAVGFGHMPPPENVSAFVAAMLSANLSVSWVLLSYILEKDPRT